MRSTQNPQYSITAVLKTPHVREICDFFGVSHHNYRGFTSFLKFDLENFDDYLIQELIDIFTADIFYAL